MGITRVRHVASGAAVDTSLLCSSIHIHSKHTIFLMIGQLVYGINTWELKIGVEGTSCVQPFH